MDFKNRTNELNRFSKLLEESLNETLLFFNKENNWSKTLQRYKDGKKWTVVMDASMERIIGKLNGNRVIVEDKLNLNNEYFKIDYTIWRETPSFESSEALTNLKQNKKHNKIWELLYAIEHENNKSDWVYELKQLIMFKANNKVLISYLADDVKIEMPEIQSNITNLLNTFDLNKTENDTFLLLLGNSYNVAKEKNNIHYSVSRFFVEGGIWKIDKTNFKPIILK